jgi:hypothetical protein
MDYLVTDIDGRTEYLKRVLDDPDRTIDASAKAAGICEMNFHKNSNSSCAVRVCIMIENVAPGKFAMPIALRALRSARLP